MRTPFVALAAASALLVGACGSDASPDTGPTLPDADELTAEADALGVSALALALDRTAEATAYRMQMSMGMEMALGGAAGAAMPSLDFEADPATPYVRVESDAEGQQHTRMDLLAMMSAMLESTGLGADAATMFGGDLSMETWSDGTTLVVDVSGFGGMLAAAAGGAELPADVFSVDLARLGTELGGPEVAAALSGQTAPDPVELVGVLSDALGDAALEDGEFVGSLDFGDYAAAFGQDPTDMFGSAGDLVGDLDADELVGELQQIVEQIEVEVAVTLDGDAVDTIRFDVDMSAFMAAMPRLMASPGGAPGAETAGLEDSSFSMTMLLDYDVDPGIDVVPPSGDIPDATDRFVELFGAVLDG